MGLTASSRLENLKSSFEVYCQAQLEQTASLAVDYEGMNFDDQALPEWVQPRLIEGIRPPTLIGRDIASGQRAQGIRWLAQVNIFLRQQMSTVAAPLARLHQLRDIVLGAFAEATRIPVGDYATSRTSPPALGNLVVEEIVTDREVTTESLADELRQYAIAMTLRWVEVTTYTP
jgi:hypothetical protein